MNKTLVLICLLFPPSSTLADAADGAGRPNIIFLFADDRRADTIGAHGNPRIQAPNLDRLAAEGYGFRRNCCAGSFSGAFCVASRAMLMTGRHSMNLPANKPASNWGDAMVLSSLLASNGNYNPFMIRKSHNGRGHLISLSSMADHSTWAGWPIGRTTDRSLIWTNRWGAY